MKSYTVTTITPCYVTSVYRVEAADEDEAVDLFMGSGADFVREAVGETIASLDHSGLKIEEGDPKLGNAAVAGIPSQPKPGGDPAKKSYSVLLHYPDYMNDTGNETFYAFVEEADSIEAVALAQRQAVAAQSVEIDDPTDFHPLLVTEGHHYGQALFNK